jgi:hypothetical protein
MMNIFSMKMSGLDAASSGVAALNLRLAPPDPVVRRRRLARQQCEGQQAEAR